MLNCYNIGKIRKKSVKNALTQVNSKKIFENQFVKPVGGFTGMFKKLPMAVGVICLMGMLTACGRTSEQKVTEIRVLSTRTRTIAVSCHESIWGKI